MKHKRISQRSAAAIGLGVLAVATAACGSTQSSTGGTTTKTTKAPAAKSVSSKSKGYEVEGFYVGNYTGQYARDVVIAKKAIDLLNELRVEIYAKQDTNATVSQMHLYWGTGEPEQFVTSLQKSFANGDITKYTRGTSNIAGIDQSPVLVTPVAPFRGQPAAVVSTCGYTDLEMYGPTGKLLAANDAAGNYEWQISVTNLQLVVNPAIYGYRTVGSVVKAVAKCPTNLGNQG